jgi:uridine kinase
VSRDAFLAFLTEQIVATRPQGIARMAITGVDGAGKTTLADELAPLVGVHRPVIRASIDGFHNPRAVRHAKGRTSPEGFFRDSFNVGLFRSALLDPLAPGGNGRYRVAAFDHRIDGAVAAPELQAPTKAVLLVDGIFLQRDELIDVWDLTVFLDLPFAQSFARMAVRDGSPVDETAEVNQRYRQGQKLYFAECKPQAKADILVDYADLTAPRIVRS